MRQFLLVTAVLITATSASAREPKKATDPNKVICRTSEAIGSRLQTKKTCLTSTQWNQMEREQRDTVEKVQSLRTTNAG